MKRVSNLWQSNWALHIPGALSGSAQCWSLVRRGRNRMQRTPASNITVKMWQMTLVISGECALPQPAAITLYLCCIEPWWLIVDLVAVDGHVWCCRGYVSTPPHFTCLPAAVAPERRSTVYPVCHIAQLLINTGSTTAASYFTLWVDSKYVPMKSVLSNE